MKKIINWTFGGFFRTIGRTLAFLLLGGLLFYLLQISGFKLPSYLTIGKVYAETGTYGASQYAYYTTSCNNQSENCFLSGPSTFTSMGTISHPNGAKIGGIAFRAYLSSGYYNSGNSYTFKWRVCESTKWTNDDSLLTLRNNARIMRVDYNSINSATNAIEGDTSTVGLVISDDSSSNYCWYAQFTYTPTINIRYIGFYMSTIGFTDLEQTSGSHTGLSYYGLTTGNDFRTNGLTITYSTDATSTAINNQTTIINNSLNDQTEAINDINDNLENDNVDESIDTASDFFSSFTTSTHGLTGIITAPLSAIESLTSSSCNPLTIPLPYINKNLTLPCMRTIYDNNFGSFMTIYDAVTLGIISYWILVRIFSLVKDFKNPEHDEIEVVDL